MRTDSNWIQTFSGGRFWPLDPRPEDLSIEDIAHHLSMMCRFTGAVREFYSVAQHSVIVSRALEERVKNERPNCTRYNCPDLRVLCLWGLLHDASEAYLQDMARPVKRTGLFGWLYRRQERKLMRVICERFGLPEQEPPCVKQIDNGLLMTERRDLMSKPPRPWIERTPPLETKIVPWSPELAETMFLNRFRELTNGQQNSTVYPTD